MPEMRERTRGRQSGKENGKMRRKDETNIVIFKLPEQGSKQEVEREKKEDWALG